MSGARWAQYGLDITHSARYRRNLTVRVTAAHWEKESCEGASGVPIGGESLADQYFMEPGIGPEGVLPKVGTGCHRLHASPGWELKDNDGLRSGQLNKLSQFCNKSFKYLSENYLT